MMNSRFIIQILFMVTLMAGGMLSCTYETIEPVETEVPDSVSFTDNLIPIFNKSCNTTGCHSKGGISPDLTPANAYNSLIFFGYVDTDVPEESVIYQEIVVGSMKKYATDQDRALILKWIEQGALKN